jgi:hypothetical protein
VADVARDPLRRSAGGVRALRGKLGLALIAGVDKTVVPSGNIMKFAFPRPVTI